MHTVTAIALWIIAVIVGAFVLTIVVSMVMDWYVRARMLRGMHVLYRPTRFNKSGKETKYDERIR
jgi:uncharacterized protein YggT (Ycf19 family)